MCCILLNFHAEAQIVVGQEGSEELRQHWFRVTDAQQNKTFILFNLLQVRAVYAVVDVKTHVLQECLQCRGNGDGAPFSTHFRFCRVSISQKVNSVKRRIKHSLGVRLMMVDCCPAVRKVICRLSISTTFSCSDDTIRHEPDSRNKSMQVSLFPMVYGELGVR